MATSALPNTNPFLLCRWLDLWSDPITGGGRGGPVWLRRQHRRKGRKQRRGILRAGLPEFEGLMEPGDGERLVKYLVD